MSAFSARPSPRPRPRWVSHRWRAPWNAALAALIAAACDSAPPAAIETPPPDGRSVEAGARLWVDADARPAIVAAAEKLVGKTARGRVTDDGKAGLSAALLLGALAESDTVVTGRVRKVRQSSFPREGVRSPVTVVSLSVAGVLRGQPAGAGLEYWAWSEGSAIPPVGADIMVGLLTRRGKAETHMLRSPGAVFSMRGGALELPGIRLAVADVARSLAALEGGRP
jgi:hypothetical protein